MTSPKTVALLIFVLLLSLTWGGCSPKNDSAQSPPSGAPRFTTIRVDIKTERLEIFLRDGDGRLFKRFDRLTAWLANKNEHLSFAMNAGMFKPDLSPVGLLVQDGEEISPLDLSEGDGNFFLKPNGVFFVSDSGPEIVESSEYPALAKNVRLATQSGPLLVRNGAIHPAFSAESTSRLVRNGVGVSGDTIFFVITEQPVNFYEMAIYFRDELHCHDALYLDGVVSSLYSVDLQRNDSNTDLGPILGVVK